MSLRVFIYIYIYKYIYVGCHVFWGGDKNIKDPAQTQNYIYYTLNLESGGGIIQGVLMRWEGAMRDGGLD